MQPYTKLALISTILFLVIGMSATYNATSGVLGSVVGQTGPSYGVGNGFHNRGFLVHALVFYFVMFMMLKKMK